MSERNHACVDVALVALPVAVKQLAEVCLAEVAGVVEHDVENHLHASLVGSVDERLEGDVLRLVAVVYFAEVGCVISVIVVARSVFYYRGNPDGNNARTSGIQGALKRIDHLQDHVNKLHTQIGSYTNILESSGTRASMLYVNVESVKSDIVGADLGESMLIYKQYLLQFEAMLQTSAMIGKISLLNYM